MQRITVKPREDWQATAEAHGFRFHSPENDTYWDETACYQFSLKQIENDIQPAISLGISTILIDRYSQYDKKIICPVIRDIKDIIKLV